MQLKKILLSYSATSFFFSQIYTAWEILNGFVYSLIPVGFREIPMSFLRFFSQGGIFKTRGGIFKNRIFFKKNVVFDRHPPPLSLICDFLKIP